MALNVVIDMSHFNTVTDFDTVKGDGIVGVIHKATEGLGYVDPEYQARRAQALAELPRLGIELSEPPCDELHQPVDLLPVAHLVRLVEQRGTQDRQVVMVAQHLAEIVRYPGPRAHRPAPERHPVGQGGIGDDAHETRTGVRSSQRDEKPETTPLLTA